MDFHVSQDFHVSPDLLSFCLCLVLTLPYLWPQPCYFGMQGIELLGLLKTMPALLIHSRLICDINKYAPSTITIDIKEYKTCNEMEPILFVK